MLTLLVAINLETPCEPELLLFAVTNDHLHAAGLLEHLRGGIQHPRRSGSNPDTVCRNARGTRVGSFSISDKDESGFYETSGLGEHATGLAVCVCDVDLDSGR